jgi:uncharacterized repeat protein (TIGR03803 family)
LLYSFAGGTDGANPAAGLLLGPTGTLYGTTAYGGISNVGIIFKLDSADKETILHTFSGGNDGAISYADLIRDQAGHLYGTTLKGGPSNLGTVFELVFPHKEIILHSFSGTDGEYAYGGVIRDAVGNLFGSNSGNTVFKLDSSGAETVLYTFTGPPDGTFPNGGVIADSEGNFYGTTATGGSSTVCAGGCGTVFELTPTGTEKQLYSFSGGIDGANPYGGLVRGEAGNLYGTTYNGGAFGFGVVFEVTASGIERVLHSFTGSDGANPVAGLVRDGGGNLYGSTRNGGTSSVGTVFKLDRMGNETVLHSFTGLDGQSADNGVIRDSTGNLYGTTPDGGALGFGTVFELSLP